VRSVHSPAVDGVTGSRASALSRSATWRRHRHSGPLIAREDRSPSSLERAARRDVVLIEGRDVVLIEGRDVVVIEGRSLGRVVTDGLDVVAVGVEC
jgi:hypothetical protein